MINQDEAFYKVRVSSANALAAVAGAVPVVVAEPVEVCSDAAIAIDLYRKMFGSLSFPSIPRFNDFGNFTNYFMQKELVLAISNIRDAQQKCPPLVLSFLLDLMKYNDNRFNKFSDGYYVAAIIDALSNTVALASQPVGDLEK